MTPLAPETVTAQEINALPDRVRQYIHDLETRADPAGDVATIVSLKEQREGLLGRLEDFKGTLDDIRSILKRLETSIWNRIDDQRRSQYIPGQTCSEIDAAMESVGKALSRIGEAVKISEDDDVDSELGDAEWELGSVDLEPLRKANEQLRELGETWYEVAGDVQKAVEGAVEEISKEIKGVR